MSGEHDISLVTAKAGAVVAEGLKLSLATPGGSLTPSTITAMVGISKGEALEFAPEVKSVMAKLQAAVPATLGTGPTGLPIPNPTYHPQAATTLANLSALQNKLMPPGNHGAFGSFLTQAQGHINDSQEIQNAMNFISNTNFNDLGSGITNMSSMLDQGLTAKLGNLSSAGAAMAGAGNMFNVKDMSTFGTPTGFFEQLKSNKLANSTGLSQSLADAGVDLNNMNDPVYSETTVNVLKRINDPSIISRVTEQLGVNPAGRIDNLNDLLDVSKVVPPNQLSGLQGGFGDIGNKFKDMGASFANPAAAKNMLQNISIPSIPNLNAAAPNLNSLMGDARSTVENMIGKNLTDSPNGIPNMTDFMGIVGGGGMMKQLSQSNDISAIISGVNGSVSRAQSLVNNAGIDIDSPPPAGLSTAMNFATGLHKFGADTSGSGVSQLLQNMAAPGSKFGDSIKASLAEGKNKALMQASGIAPLNFEGVPSGEAAKNLQQGKFIPGTGAMTPQQINSIFGGGT